MRNRDIKLMVRMTKDERDHAEKLARLADSTVSDVVRRLLASAKVVVRTPLIEAERTIGNSEQIAL